jgi:methyl-accepting chemotaxis protein
MDAEGELHHLRRRVHEMSSIAQNLVTRDATMALQVNNLVSSFTEHKAESKAFMGDALDTLTTIREQVTKTNGRVNGHDREIRDLKDTMTWAIRLLVGLNVTVVGGVIVGVVVYWVNNR